METVSIQMPPAMVAALRQIAGEDDASVGAVIRDAIKRDMYRRTRAKIAQRADERAVAPLRAPLADDWLMRLAGMICRRDYCGKVISCVKRVGIGLA
jgi:Arc/MetJ-type ribon-helix-helix transcriptional regulator